MKKEFISDNWTPVSRKQDTDEILKVERQIDAVMILLKPHLY